MALGVALTQIAAEIMLERVHGIAGDEQHRRAQHPPGILFVPVEHHFGTGNPESVNHALTE